MLGDILKRVDAIVRDHQSPSDEKSMALPDSWVFTPTNITMGDVRALVSRVRECEAAVADERRAELIRVATAIYAAGSIHREGSGVTPFGSTGRVSVEQARNLASDLIDECDEFYTDATSDDVEPVA